VDLEEENRMTQATIVRLITIITAVYAQNQVTTGREGPGAVVPGARVEELKFRAVEQ